MTQEPETKTCGMCGMGIPAAARKCPYCLHWQRWLSWQNPAILVLSFLVPLLVLYGIMIQSVLGRMVQEWEPFQKHSQEVIIVEDKMAFGEDGLDPCRTGE